MSLYFNLHKASSEHLQRFEPHLSTLLESYFDVCPHFIAAAQTACILTPKHSTPENGGNIETGLVKVFNAAINAACFQCDLT